MSDLAIKYSMMKKKKRMAEGGAVNTDRSEEPKKMSGYSGMVRTDTEANQNSKGVNRHGHSGRSGGTSEAGAYYRNSQHGLKGGKEIAKDLHKQTLEESRSMPKPNLKGLAEGGEVDEHVREREEHQKGVHKTGEIQGQARDRMYKSKAADSLAPGFGKSLHEEKLKEIKMINPKMKGLADGGFVEEENMSGYVDHEGDESEQDSDHQPEDEMDMIDRIMKKRQMSEGGMIANEGEDELSNMADGDPNNFDDLSMRDDLESSYTGENSGDEDGNERLDEDEKDIVERIMRSRSKKDRLPSPR